MANGVSAQDNILQARLSDAVRLAESCGRPRFVGFLDEHESDLAAGFIKRACRNPFLFWGGYTGAERVMLGVFPDFIPAEETAFSLSVLTVSFRRQDRLTHRDFLVALLHAGIERTSLGDILTEEGRAVVFCKQEISGFLCTQVEKIGGVGVRVAEGAQKPFPPAHRFADFSAVVASARLDCLVAAAVGTSREKAAELIRTQAVEQNHEPVPSPSAEVREGDILSVRGKGRWVIDRLGPQTKKGRLGVAGRKYI